MPNKKSEPGYDVPVRNLNRRSVRRTIGRHPRARGRWLRPAARFPLLDASSRHRLATPCNTLQHFRCNCASAMVSWKPSRNTSRS